MEINKEEEVFMACCTAAILMTEPTCQHHYQGIIRLKEMLHDNGYSDLDLALAYGKIFGENDEETYTNLKRY